MNTIFTIPPLAGFGRSRQLLELAVLADWPGQISLPPLTYWRVNFFNCY